MNDYINQWIKESADAVRAELKTKVVTIFNEPVTSSDFDNPDLVLLLAISEMERKLLGKHARDLEMLFPERDVSWLKRR